MIHKTCCVFIIGTVNEIPSVHMNENGDIFSRFKLIRIKNKNELMDLDYVKDDISINSYTILANEEYALILRQLYYSGMPLLVEGDIDSKGTVFAEKITSLDYLEDNEIKNFSALLFSIH